MEASPTPAATADKANASFWHQHWQKVLAALFWLLLTGAYLFYTLSRGVSPLSLEALRPLLDLADNRWGPLLFIGLYTVRPFVLFSSVLLTLAAGALFGPVWGVVYTVVGANIGSSLAYLVGRTFGGDLLNVEEDGKGVGKYVKRMRENSFETILIMRLIYIPYDLVTYLAGFLKINYGAFLLATVLGSLPGTISVALLGASAGLDGGAPSFDPRVLLVSVGLFVVSIAVSRLVKRSENKGGEGEGGEND